MFSLHRGGLDRHASSVVTAEYEYLGHHNRLMYNNMSFPKFVRIHHNSEILLQYLFVFESCMKSVNL